MKVRSWLQPLVLGAVVFGVACSDEPGSAPTHTPGDNSPVLTMPAAGAVAAPNGAAGTAVGNVGGAGIGGPIVQNPGSQPGGANGGAGGTMMASAGSTGTAGSSAANAGSAAAAGSGAAGSASAGGTSATIKITARAIPSGGEDHICVVLPLPNTEREWITSIHASLTAGSHHLIVDRLPVGTATQEMEKSCPPTMGGDSTRLIIAQQRETMLDMPAGTALPVEPHQPVFMQLHYINLDSKPVDIQGVLEVTFAEHSATPPTEVQSLFTGAISLTIPKGKTSDGEFFFVPAQGGDKPWHVFAVTSHTHSLGVDSTIERVANQSAPATTPLHESLDWHEPPLTRFDPPLVFDGQDGLRLRCHYKNDTDHDVHFGTRFEDEMCFLWLYYYQ